MFCPVCNGMQSLQGICSFCEGPVQDYGRSSDFAGPYAPYEQIEFEQRLTSSNAQYLFECKHLLYCPACGQTTEVVVTEFD